MSTFADELLSILANPGVHSAESVRKLSQEDQHALAAFALKVVDVWQKGGPLNESQLCALWTLGFVMGHNWVKNHWALW